MLHQSRIGAAEDIAVFDFDEDEGDDQRDVEDLNVSSTSS